MVKPGLPAPSCELLIEWIGGMALRIAVVDGVAPADEFLSFFRF